MSEAAKLLGVAPSTLRRWCDKGKVPHWKTPGGQRRFERAELERWRAERRNRAEG